MWVKSLPFQLRKHISGSCVIFVDKPFGLTKGAAHRKINSFATPRLKHLKPHFYSVAV